MSHSGYGNKRYAAIPTRYRGVEYRSKAEARWAALFSLCGIDADYEPPAYELPHGRYVVDFWLRMGEGLFAEIKGSEASLTVDAVTKASQLVMGTQKPLVFLVDWPLAEAVYRLILPDERYGFRIEKRSGAQLFGSSFVSAAADARGAV